MTSPANSKLLWKWCHYYSFINKEIPIRPMNTKIILAILAIAAISLTAMVSISSVGVVSTALAQNMTASTSDTANATTFEESAKNATSGANVTG